MDINTVCLSGRLYDVGVNPTNGLYPVVEAKISVDIGKDKEGEDLYDEFNIRTYGKKSDFIAKIPEGTFIMITGRLKEDIRVNAENPNTVRSKTYINVDSIKTVEEEDD